MVKNMKIEFKKSATNSNTRFVAEFKIVGIISKEQFKNLMAYSDYNKISRIGKAVFYKEEQVNGFCAYIESINADVTEYKIEAKKISKKAPKISFEEFCSDMFDQDIALMSREEKTQARVAYNKI